ncbi:MAG: hypothetical protein QGG48_13940, partial [Desulfatiglandales bacterium]|nr:hypothetical protein [Desulfatiglandales bacterium]
LRLLRGCYEGLKSPKKVGKIGNRQSDRHLVPLGPAGRSSEGRASERRSGRLYWEKYVFCTGRSAFLVKNTVVRRFF